MAKKFDKIWVLAEILLFVYIGTEVRIAQVDFSLIGTGLLIITFGLIFRSGGVFLSLLRSGLNKKVTLFCIIAYLPKATVQAAIGAVPLSMVLSGQMISMTADTAQMILAIAVLSIVITAPLGAIGIKWAGPNLLRKESRVPLNIKFSTSRDPHSVVIWNSESAAGLIHLLV
jgi:NhaP-type Na+/H+ or K+/H+ antiporter